MQVGLFGFDVALLGFWLAFRRRWLSIYGTVQGHVRYRVGFKAMFLVGCRF